ATQPICPLRCVELKSSIRLKATSKKRQVRPDWASSIIDPMTQRCLIDSRVDRPVAKSPNALPAIRQRARQAFEKPWYASAAVTIMATQLSHMEMLQPSTASHSRTIAANGVGQ